MELHGTYHFMASKVGDRIAPWDRGAGENASPFKTLE